MWKHKSGILTPLSSVTFKQAKWNWNNEYQKEFDTIKKYVSRETLLSNPNFNKPFLIHMDASKLQLGGVISQDDKPVIFYSRNLIKRKLLFTIETLKGLKNILLEQQIRGYRGFQP